MARVEGGGGAGVPKSEGLFLLSASGRGGRWKRGLCSSLGNFRTDYWVSQGRKYCEFCKCSIADNKPSIQFHESGKKHKENVAKRITEMQKKAAKEAKDAVDFDKEMKRVEAAALKAYMNDVKSNADYTSHLIQSGIEKLPTPEYVEPEPKPRSAKKKPGRKGEGKKWMEAVTEEGQPYYWNADTGESVWEKPAGGFLSIADQKKPQAKPKPKPKPPKGYYKGKKKHNKPGKGNFVKNKQKQCGGKAEEEKSKLELPTWLPLTSQPFGKWKKVEEPKRKVIDLQLPRQEFVEIVVPRAKEESGREFKEKTSTPGSVASAGGETGFKKRKIASDARKNIRQRLNDD